MLKTKQSTRHSIMMPEVNRLTEMTGLPLHRTLLTLISLTTEPLRVKHDPSHFWPTKKNVVYSVPAAGRLTAQLACRQSVVIGWKMEMEILVRRSLDGANSAVCHTRLKLSNNLISQKNSQGNLVVRVEAPGNCNYLN